MTALGTRRTLAVFPESRGKRTSARPRLRAVVDLFRSFEALAVPAIPRRSIPADCIDQRDAQAGKRTTVREQLCP